MYLKIGNRMRPFNEANASINYEPMYDASNRIMAINETWTISGTIVQQENATQSNMSIKIRQLQADFNQQRPSLVFIEDNGVTETALKLDAGECLDGPKVLSASFPQTEEDVYPTGVSYSVVLTAKKRSPIGDANPILEYNETLQPSGGGPVYVVVGGAINYGERQLAKQHEPWRCVQRGRAVGLYGRPIPPPPIWPQALSRRTPPTLHTPRILGPIPQEFEVEWEYHYEWPVALVGTPHVLF